jgi:hypothetical protein
MALSWPNLPCALKAGIGIGKRTLGDPRRAHGHAAAWDARESGLWQPPQQAATPSAARTTKRRHAPRDGAAGFARRHFFLGSRNALPMSRVLHSGGHWGGGFCCSGVKVEETLYGPWNLLAGLPNLPIGAHLLKLAEAWLDLAKVAHRQSGQRVRNVGEHPLVRAKLSDQRAA